MALRHAKPLDVISLFAAPGEGAGAVSTSLLKTKHIQLLRLVLAAGESLPEHKVSGEITVQCLSGEADVIAPRRTCRLQEGTVVTLPAAKPHRVKAYRETVLLVTILQP